MRVMVIFCHPVETSFHASLHQDVVASLRAAGHEVDDCDLYAEGFNPVMSREERLGYHDEPSTYSRPRWMALYMGDPPRRIITRYLPRLTGPGTRTEYHAHYHMNVATEASLGRFRQRVVEAMRRF